MKDDRFYVNNSRTVSLEWEASRCADFDEFEKKFSGKMLRDDGRLSNYLQDLIWKYDRSYTSVSVDANLSSGYVGNIVNGITRQPDRNVLLSICFALKATVEETQELLKSAGYPPLYIKRRRDVVIWFGLTKGEDLDTVNANLEKRGYQPLCKEK